MHLHKTKQNKKYSLFNSFFNSTLQIIIVKSQRVKNSLNISVFFLFCSFTNRMCMLNWTCVVYQFAWFRVVEFAFDFFLFRFVFLFGPGTNFGWIEQSKLRNILFHIGKTNHDLISFHPICFFFVFTLLKFFFRNVCILVYIMAQITMSSVQAIHNDADVCSFTFFFLFLISNEFSCAKNQIDLHYLLDLFMVYAVQCTFCKCPFFFFFLFKTKMNDLFAFAFVMWYWKRVILKASLLWQQLFEFRLNEKISSFFFLFIRVDQNRLCEPGSDFSLWMRSSTRKL